MTKKQKNKTTEDKDETIIEMAPIINEKYTKLFLIISLTLSSLSIVLMIFFFIWFSSTTPILFLIMRLKIIFLFYQLTVI